VHVRHIPILRRRKRVRFDAERNQRQQRSLPYEPYCRRVANRSETILLRERFSMLKVVGQAFRARDDNLLRAPWPERWVELIRYLNENEWEASRPGNEARRNSSESHPYSARDP
jgi:hypothetical protein